MSIFKIFKKGSQGLGSFMQKSERFAQPFSVEGNVEYKQKVNFDEHYMGRRKNFSLRNTSKGFGVKVNKFVMAMDDYKAQMREGTLHSMAALPKHISAPVFLATTCRYGHVGVWHKGKLYVNGVVDNKQMINAICWAEKINGVRVVEVVKHGEVVKYGSR